MKLVQFDDGTFGVRAYWFFGWRFRDLKEPQFTWTQCSGCFKYCKGTRERALEVMKSPRGYKVVKP